MLVASDGYVKVHSVVLAAASAVFKESLRSNQKPEERVIVFPELELYLLKIVVHFAYTGSIVVPKKYFNAGTSSRVVSVLMMLGFNVTIVRNR